MNLRYALRRAGRESQTRPLMVLLHGYGADEKDLASLASEFDARLNIVFPRAPRETPFGGYGWFDIEWNNSEKTYDLEQAAESVSVFASFLVEMKSEYEPRATIVAGFSQGGMIAAGVAARHTELGDAYGILSGGLLPNLLPLSELVAEKPVLIQHGVQDEMVPIEFGRDAAEEFRRAGSMVEYREYQMGHEISAPSLAEFANWVQMLILEPPSNAM